MNAVHSENLTGNQVLVFLNKLAHFKQLHAFYDSKKNQWEFVNDAGAKQAIVSLPVLWRKPNSDISCEAYSLSQPEVYSEYGILLAQAGQAALAYVKEGNLLHHKVIRKYMVRKSQGKSQLSYLKTKGKSREGSRIRLANSLAFFEEIHQQLTKWQCKHHSQIMLYNMPPALWGYLFSLPKTISLDKNDERWVKLKVNLDQPGFEHLKKTLVEIQFTAVHLFDSELIRHLPDK